jgi:hypothetical protein
MLGSTLERAALATVPIASPRVPPATDGHAPDHDPDRRLASPLR